MADKIDSERIDEPMPMNKQVIGKDEDGKDVVMVWGAELNWAHGFVEGPEHQQKEYYRAQGRSFDKLKSAHYIVARDVAEKRDAKNHPIFRYWYVIMHIDGKTINLPTEFMSAYEGQEVCQIFESERGSTGSPLTNPLLKNAHARIENKKGE